MVNNELFPEQSRKLIERSDVTVREANKPLSVVPVNVHINILQCIVFVPLKIIIWALNVVRWASGSSAPVKTILGVMKLTGMTTSIIACENGLGRALR